ncbi:response regulator [Paenibacillus sp. MBLB4367]|uniref:response regulator n=1 Tax=Paenibacillus sp. MBLB4367 TaxID=3384767 RepID=UPI00390831B6
MYRVMLIDDEKWIVKSLKSSIDWRSLGFEIIAEAFNGEEGFEKIKELTPDLVFTDIRMPGMDGLELMRRINEWNPDISFIITSGYKEFEYAKKAIQYGALDYCLKPFDEEEISEILRKYSRKRQAQGAMLQIELLNLLQEKSAGAKPRIEQIMGRLGLPWDGEVGATVLVVISSDSEPASLPELPCIPRLSLQTGRKKCAHLFRGDQTAALYDRFSEALPSGVEGIGIGKRIMDPAELIQAIGEADSAAHHFFIAGKSGCWLASAENGKAGELKELLWKLSKSQNTEWIDPLIERVRSCIEGGHFTIRSALSFYHMVLFSLYPIEEEHLITYEELVSRFRDMDRLIDYVRELLTDHYTRSIPVSAPGSQNATFLKIVAYVDTHFREDISLQSVSDQLDLNLSYVSQLFRKEGADTFLQYLTKKRIAYACELLADSSTPIQEVAEQAGYLDYFHFAKTFKKSTGQTATQYRETYAKGEGHE